MAVWIASERADTDTGPDAAPDVGPDTGANAGAAARACAGAGPDDRARPGGGRPGRSWRARGRLAILAASLTLPAACGVNMEQRAATGALGGLIVAGPVGAAVGAAVGAVVNEVEEDRKDP